MIQSELKFDGKTYDPELDEARLATQMERVENLMQDGKWRTLTEIQKVVGGSEAGISARLRDLRKERFGSHLIQKRRREPQSAGIYEYKLWRDNERII